MLESVHSVNFSLLSNTHTKFKKNQTDQLAKQACGNDSNQRQNKTYVRVLNKDAMAAKILLDSPNQTSLGSGRAIT